MIAFVILGHSTTSFSENVVVAETSYQMLKVLSFCDRDRAKPSGRKNVLRKLLRILLSQAQGGLFCVLTVFDS